MTPGGRRDLVLAGPMGAGKSTVGRIAAGWLDASFDDLDAMIVAREGRSIPDLFAQGEAVFRAAEQRALDAWLARPSDAPPAVLALGGGTLEAEAAAAALARRAVVVALDAPGAALAARLDGAARAARPLLARADDPAAALDALRARRAAGYARAEIALDTAPWDPPGAAIALLAALHDAGRGPWHAPPAPIDPATPEVTRARGAVAFPPAECAVLFIDDALPPVHRARVAAQCAQRAGKLVTIARHGGEGAKTPASLAAAWEELLAARVDRDWPLWGVGGGTLTDLAGFVAHSYKRGLPLHLLPTTLLGQLDAALGGKNGINVGGAKNAAGTTRLPQTVHLDPLFLPTLAQDDLACGLAEGVKSALIGDPPLFDAIESGAARLAACALPRVEEVAARAARVKLGIVARDLEERGERRLLNLGHTLGHAIEAATAHRPAPVPHGAAVAIGTAFALRLSHARGLLAEAGLPHRVEATLAALGLPVRLPALAGDEYARLVAALAADKKRAGGASLWVLVRATGELAVEAVPPADVLAALDAFPREAA